MYNITECYIAPNKEKNFSLFPLFLPFAGCPQICTYCNQSLQTGKNTDFLKSNREETEKNLLEAENHIISSKAEKKELAFYGGTFTLMEEGLLYSCLNFAKKQKEIKNIQLVRCSTRPDALGDSVLSLLKEYGVDTIELGIQSFHTKALFASKRGYTGDLAKEACKKIKKAGFNLGIQLLPNLPGLEPEEFIKDVEIALSLNPDCMRFYPCLVVEGTQLGTLWKSGQHKIWDFQHTIDVLGEGLFMAWEKQVPVIRIGVAPEPTFYKEVLAGVQHPHLGQLVQSKALMESVTKALEIHEGKNPFQKNILYLPQSVKGYYMEKEHKEFWSAFPCEVKFTREKNAYLKGICPT